VEKTLKKGEYDKIKLGVRKIPQWALARVIEAAMVVKRAFRMS